MMRLLVALFAASIDASRISTLRGPDALSPAPAAAPSVAVGLCGCTPVPADQCKCGHSIEYLKCVALKCAAGCECPKHPLEQECASLSQSCGAELEFEGCGSNTITCDGRFHQDKDDVIGLTLDTSQLNKDAYCGPHGRCLGTLRLSATAHRKPPGNGTWLQCILPSKDVNWGSTPLSSRLQDCHAEISAGQTTQHCTWPMVPDLDPAAALHGHCFLTQGQHGKQLTKDAWFLVRNRYETASTQKATSTVKKLEIKVGADVKIVEDDVEEDIPE